MEGQDYRQDYAGHGLVKFALIIYANNPENYILGSIFKHFTLGTQ
jgi:hypothetical protein